MKLHFYCDENERHSNIGIAKALTEELKVNDLREIVQYLMVFVDNNSILFDEIGVGLYE
jgi:hypothetical protein